MRVLITGALGFIGSHLAETYLHRGHEVYGIDDLSGNVVDGVPGMACMVTDVRNIMSQRHPPDLVVHAASPVGPAALLERDGIVAEVVETTQAVLRYCRARDVPLVNISSSEVYGFNGVYRETDACVVPHRLSHRIQYAAGKLAAEHLVRTSVVPAVNVRPFNIAGPRQSREKGFVIPTFCEQALAGQPLTVFEDGLQERCPTGVWDLTEFIYTLDAAFIRQLEPCRRGGIVVNVGNPANRTTVLDLANRVREIAGSCSELVFTTGKAVHGPEFEEAEGHVKVPDAGAARAFGWEAKVGLGEMIERTVAEIDARQGVA